MALDADRRRRPGMARPCVGCAERRAASRSRPIDAASPTAASRRCQGRQRVFGPAQARSAIGPHRTRMLRPLNSIGASPWPGLVARPPSLVAVANERSTERYWPMTQRPALVGRDRCCLTGSCPAPPVLGGVRRRSASPVERSAEVDVVGFGRADDVRTRRRGSGSTAGSRGRRDGGSPQPPPQPDHEAGGDDRGPRAVHDRAGPRDVDSRFAWRAGC